MPWEWPKRCFSWPEEALLTNDEDFICVPREHLPKRRGGNGDEADGAGTAQE